MSSNTTLLMVLGSLLIGLSYTEWRAGIFLFWDSFTIFAFLTLGIVLLIVGYVMDYKQKKYVQDSFNTG